jgi:hypothetical protein
MTHTLFYKDNEHPNQIVGNVTQLKKKQDLICWMMDIVDWCIQINTEYESAKISFQGSKQDLIIFLKKHNLYIGE